MNLPKFVVLIALTCAPFLILKAQTAPGTTELCGAGRPEQGPDDISITITQGEGTAFLRAGQAHSDAVRLPGVQDAIAAVCPISHERLLIFGRAGGAYNIMIFDRARAAVADSFYAYDPKVSPDQRWVVARSFYPPQSNMVFSEEYMVYDLSGADQKLGATEALRGREKVIYPLSAGDGHFERTGLPKEQMHKFCSDAFYWSPNSRILSFADCVERSLNIVMFDVKSQITRIYPLDLTAKCQDRPRFSDSRVTGVSFDPANNFMLTVSVLESSCGPEDISLTPADFVPATVERRKAPNRKPAVRIQ